MSSIVQVAEEYVKWDPNEESRQAVANLLQQGKTAELQAILGSRLVFGTAGLRGPMGAGYNRMNELVVLQTTQGLIKYMEGLDASVKAKVAGFVSCDSYVNVVVIGCCYWIRSSSFGHLILQRFR